MSKLGRVVAGLLVVTAVCLLVALTGCSNGKSNTAVIGQDNNAINGDVQRLQQAEPLPHLRDSANLRIQNYYYTAEADPNKIWYLVTQGLNGNPTGYYTIRGPVENTSDQVTNPEQQVCAGGSNGEKNCDTVGLAEPNAIYQGNSNDHLAILTDGAILRWEGYYQTSDQPFHVVQTPTVSINENAAISATDTSRTSGGRVPQRSR